MICRECKEMLLPDQLQINNRHFDCEKRNDFANATLVCGSCGKMRNPNAYHCPHCRPSDTVLRKPLAQRILNLPDNARVSVLTKGAETVFDARELKALIR